MATIDPNIPISGTHTCSGVDCLLIVQSNPINQFDAVLSKVIGVLTLVGALWFVVQMFSAALQWISAGGDKAGVEAAKKKITNSFAGLFIVVIAYAAIAVVGGFFGFNIVDLKGLFSKIAP